MFRYGGPIKEGIMSGMKDNRQAINTVGSPLAPKDETGRGGYAAPLLFTLPYLGAAARLAARPFGQFITRQSRGGKMLGLKPVETFKPTKLGSYLASSPEGRLLTGGAGLAGKTGSTIFKAGKGLAKSPLTLATAGFYGGKGLINQFKDDPIKEGEIPGQSTSAINKAKAAIGMPENLTYGGGREPTIDDPKKTKS